jgi:phosphatidylinositol kinase/protein kinase (PI-3  family)
MVKECLDWSQLYMGEDNIDMIFKQEHKVDRRSQKNLRELIKTNKEFDNLDQFMSEAQINRTIEPPTESTMDKDTKFDKSSINPFGKVWTEIYDQIKATSPYRKFITYSIKNFIAKANDDLRQELLAMQLIKKFQEIFIEAEIPLNLRPYEILITSSSSGLIEFLVNTNSIDGIKKKLPKGWNLNDFYRHFYTDHFDDAQKCFAESLAGYSLICYYLQIKDRHNGNILLDMKGNIIHIDFGFILGINPGNLNFESASFKLTREYVEILDGINSPMFEYYKSLMIRGMLAAKQHMETMTKMAEIMSRGMIKII